MRHADEHRFPILGLEHFWQAVKKGYDEPAEDRRRLQMVFTQTEGSVEQRPTSRRPRPKPDAFTSIVDDAALER